MQVTDGLHLVQAHFLHVVESQRPPASLAWLCCHSVCRGSVRLMELLQLIPQSPQAAGTGENGLEQKGIWLYDPLKLMEE